MPKKSWSTNLRSVVCMTMKMPCVVIICFAFIGFKSNAQDSNTLYFLADTIHTPKDQRAYAIKKLDAFEYAFTFYCKCTPPFDSYFSLRYYTTRKDPKAKIETTRPNHPYISLEKLLEVVHQHHRFLNDTYDIYITEVLPGNKYRTNKVTYCYRAPVESKENKKPKS